MLNSMTGFASCSAECAPYTFRLDIKSVNHRYLDVQCKLPDEYRFLENDIRQKMAEKLARGKVECRLSVETQQKENSIKINTAFLDDLMNLQNDLRSRYPEISPLSFVEILRHPGVLADTTEDADAYREAILRLIDDTLIQFKNDRAREGESLRHHIQTRLDQMSEHIELLQERFPVLLQEHCNRIQQRLRDAVSVIDNDRLQQEFALFMQKSDVDEEFSRLKTHIDEVSRIINQSSTQAVGKRLDFLMQELNREANTLGSKAISIECTQTSVALKVLIEQMREQVQNIE